MRIAAATIVAFCLLTSSAFAAELSESSVWRPGWSSYTFSSTAQDTPQFLTRYVQLPATVVAGDVILVNGREEFSNPSWNSQGAWVDYLSGHVSEHWSTPIMGACGLKRGVTPGVVTSGAWISQQVAENFDGIQHHWVYDASEAYPATALDAGAWVAIQCYFSRSLAYRDLDADYVQALPTFGRVEAVVVK